MKYRLNHVFLVIIIVLFLNQGCSSLFNSSLPVIETNKKYSIEELKEDFDFLFNTYEQVHPDLYVNTPKCIIDSLRSQTEEKLSDSLTSFDFYKLTSPVVSRLGDGHTNIGYPYEFRNKYLEENGKIFPLNVSINDNRLFVRQNFTDDSTLSINSEILSINGIPAKEMLIELRKYKPGESAGFIDEYVQWMFKPLLWTRYNFDDDYIIEYISKTDSGQYSKSISGITLVRLDSISNKMNQNQERYLPWTFKILKDENMAILDINTFGTADDLEKFKYFLDSSFTLLQKYGIKDLIIDVRNNGGGDNQNGEALIDYLAVKPWVLSSKGLIKLSDQFESDNIPWIIRWMPVKLLFSMFGSMFTSMEIETIETELDSNGTELLSVCMKPKEPLDSPLLFRDNMYVLINHGSYSMSVMFAAVMKDYDFAALIGEETGQPASPFGAVYSFCLPNTKLRAGVPAGRSFRPSGVIDNKGVMPDYEVKQNAEDMEKKIDTVLEFTKQLIEKNK